MKIRIPRPRPAAHAGKPVSDGPQCDLGCFGVELDDDGLVKDHAAWYPGGRRTCYGSGRKPKGSAQ